MNRDALSDLLRSVRLRGAVFYYVSFRDRWSAEAPPGGEIAEAVMPGCEHVMEYHMIAKGSGWAAVSGQPPIKLAAGDIVMFPQGDRHVLSSAPDVEPFRLTPDWVFSTRNAPKPLPISYHHGVVEPGGALPVEEASTIAVCGFLGCDLKPFNPLIAALPRILHLPAARAGDWVGRVIDQAVTESNHPRPGGEAVLERLSEMMFVDAARRYLDDIPEDATGWRGFVTGSSAEPYRSCTSARITPGPSTRSLRQSACPARRCTSGSRPISAWRPCSTLPTGASSSHRASCRRRARRWRPWRCRSATNRKPPSRGRSAGWSASHQQRGEDHGTSLEE
jgi:hypothetical protein